MATLIEPFVSLFSSSFLLSVTAMKIISFGGTCKNQERELQKGGAREANEPYLPC